MTAAKVKAKARRGGSTGKLSGPCHAVLIVKRVGRSLYVMIPDGLAAAAGIEEGAAVRLLLVMRQIVIEPVEA